MSDLSTACLQGDCSSHYNIQGQKETLIANYNTRQMVTLVSFKETPQ